jgi:hypothetical protein
MPYRIGPKYIPEFVKTESAQEAWLHENLPASKIVYTWKGFPVRVCQLSETHSEFFVENSGQILYQMSLRKVSVSTPRNLPEPLRKRASFQASLWRHGTLVQFAPGLPAAMFWKFLVSNSRNILSDSQQSDRGEAFWENRIAEALNFEGSYRVYGLDCEHTGSSLSIESASVLTSVSGMAKYYSDEQDMSGYYKRLAIVKI